MRAALLALTLLACSSPPAAEKMTPDAAPAIPASVHLSKGEIGIEACDKVIALMRACINAMPAGSTRSSSTDTLQRSIDGWKNGLLQGGPSAYQPIQDMCLRGLDTIRPQMPSMCPGVPTE